MDTALDTSELSGSTATLAETAEQMVAGLRPGWMLLENCRLGDVDASPVRFALVHPAVGVALLDLAPALRPDAVAQLGGRLDAAKFGSIFPGHLPVVHRAVPARQLRQAGTLIDYAFALEPALALPGNGAWVGMVQRALDPAPAAAAGPPRLQRPQMGPGPASRRAVPRGRRWSRGPVVLCALLGGTLGIGAALLAIIGLSKPVTLAPSREGPPAIMAEAARPTASPARPAAAPVTDPQAPRPGRSATTSAEPSRVTDPGARWGPAAASGADPARLAVAGGGLAGAANPAATLPRASAAFETREAGPVATTGLATDDPPASPEPDRHAAIPPPPEPPPLPAAEPAPPAPTHFAAPPMPPANRLAAAAPMGVPLALAPPRPVEDLATLAPAARSAIPPGNPSAGNTPLVTDAPQVEPPPATTMSGPAPPAAPPDVHRRGTAAASMAMPGPTVTGGPAPPPGTPAADRYAAVAPPVAPLLPFSGAVGAPTPGLPPQAAAEVPALKPPAGLVPPPMVPLPAPAARIAPETIAERARPLPPTVGLTGPADARSGPMAEPPPTRMAQPPPAPIAAIPPAQIAETAPARIAATAPALRDAGRAAPARAAPAPVASAPAAAARAAPPPEAPAQVASRVSPRCGAIIMKIQLGEEPTSADRSFLRNGCGAR